MLCATRKKAEACSSPAPALALRHALEPVDELLQVLQEGVDSRLKGAPKVGALKQLAPVLELLHSTHSTAQHKREAGSKALGPYATEGAQKHQAATRVHSAPPQARADAAASRSAAWLT